MNYFLKIFFYFFVTQSIISCCHDPIMPKEFTQNAGRAIALYYAAKIEPWHTAARQTIQEFNQQHPEQKLQEQNSEKMHNLSFQFKDSSTTIELKIKQDRHLDTFRIKLTGPNLHKEHVAQNPDTMKTALFNMLLNHLVKKQQGY